MKKTLFRAPLLAAVLAISLIVPVCAVFHPAYLTGYPDGTIRPDAAVTRAQLAVVLSRLAETPSVSDGEAPPDVPAAHWAHEAVRLVCGANLMSPDADGRFRPEDTVTGPELAWTLARLTREETAGAVWPTLRDGWAAQDVSFAGGMGWVMGFDGTQFDAEAALTRAQLAQIFNTLLGRTPQTLDDLLIGMPIFSDNRDTSAWYFLPLQEAAIPHTADTANGERWTALG